MNVAIIGVDEGGVTVAEALREVIAKLEACGPDQEPMLSYVGNRSACRSLLKYLRLASNAVDAELDRCKLVYRAESFVGSCLNDFL